jgi:LacI family transcriptional regulator
MTSTLKELAKVSGVSVATVSRALNGRPGVSDATRDRLRALADELDYVPSAAAQTLVTSRSHLVGVVLDTGADHPDLQHPFFQSVLAGLRRCMADNGFDLMLFATDLRGDDTQSLLSRCRRYQVDGLVLVAVDTRGPEFEKVERSSLPCVTVDLDFAGIRTADVASDNVEGAALAVQHLAALGHTKIATIAVPTRLKPGRERLVGYREALNRLGLEYRADYVVPGDGYPRSGASATKHLLELQPRPTAIFVGADLMAIGALQATAQLGVRVPDDVAIVGFDDIPLATLTQPPLSTVRQDAIGLGVAAARALMNLLGEASATQTKILLPVELVVRETCGGAPSPSDRSSGDYYDDFVQEVTD